MATWITEAPAKRRISFQLRPERDVEESIKRTTRHADGGGEIAAADRRRLTESLHDALQKFGVAHLSSTPCSPKKFCKPLVHGLPSGQIRFTNAYEQERLEIKERFAGVFRTHVRDSRTYPLRFEDDSLNYSKALLNWTRTALNHFRFEAAADGQITVYLENPPTRGAVNSSGFLRVVIGGAMDAENQLPARHSSTAKRESCLAGSAPKLSLAAGIMTFVTFRAKDDLVGMPLAHMRAEVTN